MAPVKPLPADALARRCDPASLGFVTTADLEPLEEVIGQDRAVDAIEFGIGIDRRGFNVFVHGPSGHGKATAVQRFLDRHARSRPPAWTWCYLYNFEVPHRPRALRLPPGRGARLRDDMARLVDDLLALLPAALEAETHLARRSSLAAQHQQRPRSELDDVVTEAESKGLSVIETDGGLRLVPTVEVAEPPGVPPRAPVEDERERVHEAIAAMRPRLAAALHAVQLAEREVRRVLAEADREAAGAVLGVRLEELRAAYADEPGVLAHLEALAADVLDRLELFRRADEPAGAQPDGDPIRDVEPSGRRRSDPRLRRYAVNVLVDPDPAGGAPVVFESYPTLPSLVGRIEQEQRFGALVTDFTLIRAGALHRANGGYLLLESDELLRQPNSWDALKRALRNDVVRIDPVGDAGVMTTITLEPEPIPLSVKVVLTGETGLYFHLFDVDDDFAELFKVPAEFAATMPRSETNVRHLARLVAGLGATEGLLPFGAEAVARVVDHASRVAEDAYRLSADLLDIADLVRESDYWARRRGADVVTGADVDRSVGSRERRSDLLREVLQDDFSRGVVQLDTDGGVVGQVNGLTLLDRGEFEFGVPVRVTARVRMGSGEVIDIDREVDLSGPLHSKGVLVLSGFLSGRYLTSESLAASISLTFEQLYQEIDGDSASCAELCVIMSALSGLPVTQALAVTGSVDQAGSVQAVGGINEKVEGFFDLCRSRELTGRQGAVVPASNVQHLMLRADVVSAVAEGRFHVYPVSHVDEAIEVLTGVPAGERDPSGEYPAGTVNRLIEDRLRDLAEKRKEHGHPLDEEADDDRTGGAGRSRPRRSTPAPTAARRRRRRGA